MPPDTGIKWAMVRVIALRLEDAGVPQALFAHEVGEDPEVVKRWLGGIVGDISIDRVAAIFDSAADRTDNYRLDYIIDNAYQ